MLGFWTFWPQAIAGAPPKRKRRAKVEEEEEEGEGGGEEKEGEEKEGEDKEGEDKEGEGEEKTGGGKTWQKAMNLLMQLRKASRGRGAGGCAQFFGSVCVFLAQLTLVPDPEP